jgi:hypothetical protein
MTKTEQSHSAERILEAAQDAEQSAFEAVRKFVDTVDGVFPDLSQDEGPRRKIIDSAFKMVENLVGTSNKLAENVLQVSAKAMDQTPVGAGKK